VTPTVVVVGSINVDLVTFVEKLPHPGETVSGGTFVQVHGGKGANQAVAAARLGAQVVLVGMLGDDDLGRSARAELGSEGIAVDEIRTGSKPTGVAQILVDASAENLIAVASGANHELTAAMVEESLGRVDADSAVVCSVLEVPDEAVAAAAAISGERGWPFILDPAPAKPLPDELLARCSVLTPNEHEISYLGKSSPADLVAAGVGAVVVTRGGSGVDVVRANADDHHQPGFPIEAVDTTGAGDTFSGALAWALADGAELEAAVARAAAAAAISVGEKGARGGMPTRAQLDRFLEERS
jgi:ribokinase